MRAKRILACVAALVLAAAPVSAYAMSAVLLEPEAYAMGGGVKPQFQSANHILMLRVDGSLLGWGDNRKGQLGLGAGAETKYTDPVEIPFFKGKAPIKQVLAIQDASYVLLQNGEVYSCGSGANGRLGQGLLVDFNTWKLIPGSIDLGIFALYGNSNSASVYAITADDTLLACGKNDVGQLGVGSTNDVLSFTKVMDNANIKSLHIGADFATIVTMDDTFLVACGASSLSTGSNYIPTEFYKSVDAYEGSGKLCSHMHPLVFYEAGKFLAEADKTPKSKLPPCNQVGFWYDNYLVPSETWKPTMQPHLPGHTFFSTGNQHGILQDSSGIHWGWGEVNKKQLLNNASTVIVPTKLTALNDKIAELKLQGYEDFRVQVAGDSNYLTCYNTITSNHKAFGWGSNTRGKLGVDSELPTFAAITEITTLDGIKIEQIVAGTDNVFFVAEGGDLWATGDNVYGQLGLGKDYTAMTSNIPRLVPGLKYSETAVPPTIDSVEVSDQWGATNTVTINATNDISGVGGYAFTSGDTAPADEKSWQLSAEFEIKENGDYYAWARDTVGNVSEPKAFTVSRVDDTPPGISSVTVTPAGWTNFGTKTITITAEDGQSGGVEYGITTMAAPAPKVWQTENTFTRVGGTYTLWAKDAAGNTSSGEVVVDGIDTDKPTISGVTKPGDWGTTNRIRVNAADTTSEVQGYTVTTDSAPPPDDWPSWKPSAEFEMKDNGTSYYAWARDLAGNLSNGWFFTIGLVDNTAPGIASVAYSADNTTVMIRGKDSESGVKQIFVNDIPYLGSTISWDVPLGTKYIKLQVEDNVGNLSPEINERVPGWFDELGTITILPVVFSENNKKAAITGKSSSGEDIRGIHINGRFYTGNPVNYTIPTGIGQLELQAQDMAGDRSPLYQMRIPGWSQEVNTLSISDVRFAADNASAVIVATETANKGIRGIRVNGELQPGNPVTYPIPEGTQHLELVAEDNDGDRSPKLIRRVPGWSQVVTTLSVSDISFLDYNKTVQVTATATGGDTVAGVEINGHLLEGNPVVYPISGGTTLLHIQAINPEGDKSPMVNKVVPLDASKSTLKLSIIDPGWTKKREATVRLVAADTNRIVNILARTAEDSDWADVTKSRNIKITDDTTIYASVENDKGEIKEVSLDIECFDRIAPRVTATQDGKNINIRATDDKSGVTAILVNNKEYQRGNFEDGKLSWQIPEGTTLVTIKAEDAAGNLSNALDMPLATTVTGIPVIVAPTPAPPTSSSVPEPIPEETAIPEPPPEESVPESTPEPEPVPIEPAPEPEPPAVPPVAQAVVAVGGIGSTAAGGVWYWLRKMKLQKPVEELDLSDKQLLYDESEYGGPLDPLDKKKED